MTRPTFQTQPTVRIPLTPADLVGGQDGSDLVCRMPFEVVTITGRTTTVRFRIDTGATRTVVSLAAAEFYGLSVPDGRDKAVFHKTPTGRRRVRVRDGRITAWWTADKIGTPFDWPVRYLLDAPTTTPPLLGFGGVIRDCRWTFDGRPTDAALFGIATFEDVRLTIPPPSAPPAP